MSGNIRNIFGRLIVCALLALSVGLPAVAGEKVTATWDKSLQFSKFKTYSWAPHGAVSHPILAADIVAAIDDALSTRGLKKVQSNPDLIVQVYGAIDADETMYSNDPLYAGTGGIPLFDPSATGPADIGFYGNTSVVIHQGQMVVDLIDARSKKLAWRGMVTDGLSAHNPDKLMQEVNNGISAMFKKYPQ